MPGMIQPKRELVWLEPDSCRVTVWPLEGGEPRTRELPFSLDAYLAWQSGAYIQDALHMLSASDREFLQTGMTNEEWDAMCKEEEGDD